MGLRVGLFLLCLAACAIAPVEAQTPPATAGEAALDVELFGRSGCPRCASAKAFLQELERSRHGLRVAYRAIDDDPRAAARLRALAERSAVSVPGVPAFWIRGRLLVGFDGPSTTGRAIIALLDGVPLEGEPAAGTCSADELAPCAPAPPDAVSTRLFGTLRASALGLPAFTLLLGLCDGFNPCAMWVLLFLLSLLVNLHDRKRMALIAGVFVLASGAVYFMFMAAWLNVFLLVGMSSWVRVVLGVVALGVAAINIKDFVAFKRGVSLTISDAQKPRIYERARRVLRAETLAGSLLGVAALAVLVNFLELLCTAGFPAVYTAILASRELSAAQHYGYLALYNVAYVLDDGVMVGIAVWTLAKRKLTERAGRWLKLVSGVVMLALALALLFFPELLR